MEYRRLGRSGLQVSVLSFGSWVTFGGQLDVERAAACMAAAREAGVNFFDNAEVYAGGESERVMGEAIRTLGWERHSYVVTSKYFWGLHDDPNMRHTLNRKYLLGAVEASLERFGLDHLDVVYCHRADPHTPLRETVRAMSDVIDRGHALYWGTSEWRADEIRAAYEIADRHGWHTPITEQPQYHLLHRDRVEREYARLYTDIGLGTTTWSPLASGLLTGKYLDGVPPGSRATRGRYGWVGDEGARRRYEEALRRFGGVASELGCTMGQLAIAWCASNPDVSTVITGASHPDQVAENMGALEVLPELDAERRGEIAAIFAA